MKLSELQRLLSTVSQVRFQIQNGDFVPAHFHVTEVGVITRNFIDCGGTVRSEQKINFQLWRAEDYDHRLSPQKLLDIIALSQKTFPMEDSEIEVEYQQQTIGKFNLDFNNSTFILVPTATACLALDQCMIQPATQQKPKIKLGEGFPQGISCSPGNGCC